MEKYIINSFIKKGEKESRKNFILDLDLTNMEQAKLSILNKLNIGEGWILEEDKFELNTKENVITYKVTFKKVDND
jgi:hypothetical protein